MSKKEKCCKKQTVYVSKNTISVLNCDFKQQDNLSF